MMQLQSKAKQSKAKQGKAAQCVHKSKVQCAHDVFILWVVMGQPQEEVQMVREASLRAAAAAAPAAAHMPVEDCCCCCCCCCHVLVAALQ
jgi:hypothetical protein